MKKQTNLQLQLSQTTVFKLQIINSLIRETFTSTRKRTHALLHSNNKVCTFHDCSLRQKVAQTPLLVTLLLLPECLIFKIILFVFFILF